MDKDFLLKRSSYYYDLPDELIAQHPNPERSASRMMHLNKKTGHINHHTFTDIVDILNPDDILVVNKTRVIPARIYGNKLSGAQIEILLLNQLSEDQWQCLVRPGKKCKPGTIIKFSPHFSGEIIKYAEEGSRIIQFSWDGDFWKLLEATGNMPLPPYIKREATEKDKHSYQTVYADQRGSVAAPTAGLHFTEEILQQLNDKGIQILEVILHVGLGTFRPVKTDYILEHKMHSEHCQITDDTAQKINKAKTQGKRIIAVGTTTTRTLESFASNGILNAGAHWTDIFIYPGKKLQIIDGLITNFHMPESTLLMLVSAFAGYDNIMNAYKTAVNERYRFFSYGDAMLIL